MVISLLVRGTRISSLQFRPGIWSCHVVSGDSWPGWAESAVVTSRVGAIHIKEMMSFGYPSDSASSSKWHAYWIFKKCILDISWKLVRPDL